MLAGQVSRQTRLAPKLPIASWLGTFCIRRGPQNTMLLILMSAQTSSCPVRPWIAGALTQLAEQHTGFRLLHPTRIVTKPLKEHAQCLDVLLGVRGIYEDT